jgi:hypothetical protein
VRITTRDDSDPRSKGKKILIETAISYRPK